MSESDATSGGIVYILTNPAMPTLVKIGRTEREEPDTRIRELYGTGVPMPFTCEFAATVVDPVATERAFHQAFDHRRINPQREFFEIEPDQAIGLLKIMAIADVTPEIQSEAQDVDEQSREAAQRMIQRRPNLNFLEMGIPVGSVLHSLRNDDAVTITSEKQVRYGDEEMSLTRATRISLDNNYDVAPGPHWSFDGRVLRDIYNETYS